MHELNIYCSAMKLPSELRNGFIEAACAKDPQLLDKVRALFDKQAGGSSQVPVAVPQSTGKSIQTRIANDILIAYLADARILDTARINEIGADLLSLIQQCSGGKMVVNFNTVTFMSSAMLSKIISLNNECRNAQVELRLCAIAPSIMKVFELMKLNTSLNICKTEEKAIASFDKRGLFGSRKTAVN